MKKLFPLLFSVILVVVLNSQVKAETNGYVASVRLASGDTTKFIDIFDAWDYADENKDSVITLLRDVSLGDNFLEVGQSAFSSSRFTLDLNGYTIAGGGKGIISINSGLFSTYLELDELTIIDSSASKTGKLTNGSAEYGSGIYVEGILNFNGGTIENCTSDSSLALGAGIYAANIEKDGAAHVIQTHPAGVVNIDGGHIKNCSNNGMGGGLYVGKSGEANLISGSITNCSSTGKGGGVMAMNGSVLTMYDGFEISNCKGYMGGGIDCYSWATFFMYGGSIKNCTAERGGGLYLEGSGYQLEGRPLSPSKNYFYGGEIVNNKATECGGGIATHLEALVQPAHIYLQGKIYIKDNTLNGQPNNLYLDSDGDDFDDSAYLEILTGGVRGYIGISCDVKRKISTIDTYYSTSVICADNSNYAIKYETSDQCYYLVDFKPVPHVNSVKLVDDDVSTYDINYSTHEITAYIPRKLKDVETLTINWTGEEISENDGTDWRSSTNNPYNLKFFVGYGINQLDQDILITNTNNLSEYWHIALEEVFDDYVVCNGYDSLHTLDYEIESLNYKYYQVHPGETISAKADSAPNGYIFDKWIVNRKSNVILGEEAYQEEITMTMPVTEDGRFGLKATYKAIADFSLDKPTTNSDNDSNDFDLLDNKEEKTKYIFKEVVNDEETSDENKPQNEPNSSMEEKKEIIYVDKEVESSNSLFFFGFASGIGLSIVVYLASKLLKKH